MQEGAIERFRALANEEICGECKSCGVLKDLEQFLLDEIERAKPTTIYVVMGQTGEYSDRDDWSVCFFYDAKEAERFVELASAEARELFSKMNKDRECGNWHEQYISKYDPGFSMDYTGTNYWIETVSFQSLSPEGEGR